MKDLDIKRIWQEGNKESSFSYSDDKIDRILEKNPQNIIQKFHKTLVIEKWLNLVMLTLLLGLFLYTKMWWFAVFSGVLNLGLYFYYKHLTQKLNIIFIDSNVVDYLNETYQIIRKFMLFYKSLTTVLIFPGFFVGVYISDKNYFAPENITSPKTLLVVGVGFLVTILIAHITIYLMYGKKAKKIKQIVDMLKNEN